MITCGVFNPMADIFKTSVAEFKIWTLWPGISFAVNLSFTWKPTSQSESARVCQMQSPLDVLCSWEQKLDLLRKTSYILLSLRKPNHCQTLNSHALSLSLSLLIIIIVGVKKQTSFWTSYILSSLRKPYQCQIGTH